MTASERKTAFVDWDEKFELWGLYDENTGFCHNMFYTEEEAKHYLEGEV